MRVLHSIQQLISAQLDVLDKCEKTSDIKCWGSIRDHPFELH